MCVPERAGRRGSASGVRGRRGFTLIELLVVVLIILLVSAVTLPTVIPAITHRQMGEAARILQGAIAGARDAAINHNAPSGIRLLPDPIFNGQSINKTTGLPYLDPVKPLACNRYVPIQLAPDYTEGFVRLDGGNPVTQFVNAGIANPNQYFTYPSEKGGGYYPAGAGLKVMLVAEEDPVDPTTKLPTNPPTSWYWNVRIGDRIQFQGSGIWYTIIGPMGTTASMNTENPEMFVNVGPPGTTPPLQRTLLNGTPYNPEFLFLVNGIDDNNDGYVDNGFDGLDNDGDGIVDRAPDTTTNPITLYEWREVENWQGALLTKGTANSSLPYAIKRRPVVAPAARETALPSNVVVDLTSWNSAYLNANFGVNHGETYVPERSRLPVNPTSGWVDILLDPTGVVVPSTEYSSPSSFGMDSAFYHFWLAERSDVFDPRAFTNVPYLLPMVPDSTFVGGTPYPSLNDPLATRALKGERRLLTLFTRTGQLVINNVENFDATPIASGGPGPNYPFLAPQQGIRGDAR